MCMFYSALISSTVRPVAVAISAFAADRRHPDLVSVVVALDNFKSADFRKSALVDSLAFNSLGVVWICPDSCGIELDRTQNVVFSYQRSRKRQRVKPFRALIVSEKSIVKIPPHQYRHSFSFL